MGSNKYGQCGRGKSGKNNTSCLPAIVPFPANAKIKFIDVGVGFMGAVSSAGELYMWGRNLENQCGNGSAYDVHKPQKIEVGTEVIQISCGDTHAAVVNTNGDVFTWGWGSAGQLGHTEDMQTCTVPTHVERVSDVCMVSCGRRHTVALSANRGKVWTWGANDFGQSGIPSYDLNEDNNEYVEIEDDDTETDENAESDAGTTVGSTTWLPPQVISTLSKVSLIACGKNFTLALVECAYVPIQFAKDGNDDAMYTWVDNHPSLRDLDAEPLRAALEIIRDDEMGSDFSLLHWATYYANPDTVMLLAGENWINPDVADCNGDTPLHICAQKDLPLCASLLLECGAKPDVKNKIGKTAIHVSVEHRTIDVLQVIVENSVSNKSVVDESGNTPLHTAVRLRHFEMAKYLIENAAQAHVLDKSGKTALDYCSFKEASALKSLAQKNDVFISYAHTDLAFASKIKEFLESHAIKCWMDMTRLEAGSDWRLDIGNGLLSSKLVMFVASRASVVSDWCIKELHMAKKHNLVIIPVWFQKVEFDSEVKSLIFGRGFIDFSDPKVFVSRGNRLAKKLKHVLSVLKQSGPSSLLEIPHLTKEQLWQQQFLTVLIDTHNTIAAGDALEKFLHKQAIFACIHNLRLGDNSPYLSERQENLDHTWGIVFLVQNLAATKAEIEKWWKFADERGKKVYVCMARGDATDIKTEDLPSQALTQTSLPIFYLQNPTSLQQLVYFVHLAQREEFMAKQVGVMESKLHASVTSIQNNDAELLQLRKRFYVE